MAIDTASKRSSAIHHGSPWRGLWPIPDGTIGVGDRAHVAFLYSGFDAEVIAEICLCDFDINPVITLASLDVNPVVTLSDFDISPPCDC